MAYDFDGIELKWQAYWDAHKTFGVEADTARPKYYVLDMFPYPSGSGLHVGHPEGYTATDIISRYKRMKGFNVLHPMGWDAFGLPAENHAIRTGTHPSKTTLENIQVFTRQLKRLGFSFDWDREVATCDPKYYKWTQWIFLELYRKGLAYQSEMPINWCASCKVGLANEEVKNGECERCGHPATRKHLRQWMLRITAYAQRLLDDLDDLDWPEYVKEMQRNWIGRSEGADVHFETETGERITVFTTRPDTLFGATYMVLAPEHPLVEKLTTSDKRESVAAYLTEAASKSDLDRTELAKDKTGVFIGAYAINPVNQEKIPIWIADYVLISYGTGAIMAVPAHDERDYAFAKTYELEIREVISGGDISQAAFTGDGILVNSALINGLRVDEAKKKISAWLKEKDAGCATVHFKLRDWVFSRQRYWGEPCPLVHLEDGGVETLTLGDLPLELPEVEKYEPTGTGQSPLAALDDWLAVTLPDGRKGQRESNTMPQWAGSCWYYLRYLDPHNEAAFCDPEKEKYWMPVDLYVGGVEHAVLHLLYARFWHKVLYDLGHVSTSEPFKKLRNQGMILGENNMKMSKSRGNVVNPDDVVAQYGADALRLYEMFMGPLEMVKPWNNRGVEGVFRFLQRVWRMMVDDEGNLLSAITDETPDAVSEQLIHRTVKAVTEDIERMHFNTAISRMMEFTNEMMHHPKRPKSVMARFVLLLSPYAPHICEELWALLGHDKTLAYEAWPDYDETLVALDEVEIPVAVNGKVRYRMTLAKADTEDKDTLQKAALDHEKIQKYIQGKEVRKVIVIPGKMVNVVVK